MHASSSYHCQQTGLRSNFEGFLLVLAVFRVFRLPGIGRRNLALLAKNCHFSKAQQTCSHQAPRLTFQTSSTLYFHRRLSPSFPSFPPVLRHCKRHSLVSSPPLSIVNPHVNMAAISFEHVNKGKHRVSGLSSLLWTLLIAYEARIFERKATEKGKVSYKSLKLHDFSSKEGKLARVDFQANSP